MANTTGLTDEAVESLGSHLLNLNNSNDNNNNNGLPDALRRRMEMPMGEKPAARVVRRSANRDVVASPSSSPADATEVSEPTEITTPALGNQQQQQQQKNIAGSLDEEFPVIGSIIERPAGGRKHGNSVASIQNKNNSSSNNIAAEEGSSGRLRKSRFAQQQHRKQQQQQQFPLSNSSINGFPSVNVPLGTFVKKGQRTSRFRRQQQQQQETKAENLAHHDATERTALSSLKEPPSSSFSNNTTIASLKQASDKDASAMLGQMSISEIQESVQELQTALSPETIAFLRNKSRRQCRSKKPLSDLERGIPPKSLSSAPKTMSTKTTKDDKITNVSINKPAEESSERIKPAVTITPEDDSVEKEKLAKLLSSIKTYKDMDAAHDAGDSFPERIVANNANASAGTPNPDNFDVACDLLRSSVPRQNLWAARVVSNKLEQDWKSGKHCSLSTDAARDADWPFHVLLPVSLRCLLDASVQHANGFILHTYVLQSLYSLLLLRACPDHAVEVRYSASTVATTAMAMEKTTALSSIYQMYFMEDFVPAAAVGACYSSTPLKPLSVEGGNNNTTATTPTAYYATASSTSAQTDGEAFARDPAWTLSSRMRILPRLAHLLRKHQQQQNQRREGASSCPLALPKEALQAICGILVMIGQRSPAAASAIVHHSTLLPDLLESTMVPQRGASRCNPATASSTIMLLCTLSRQSRVAAQGINVELILVQILSRKTQDHLEFQLQQWALILWRTLLRYGLCLQPLSTMLALAAPHLTLGISEKFSLSTEFLTAFTIVLNCARIAKRKDKTECTITNEQRNTLSEASIWLSLTARQVLKQMSHKESSAQIIIDDQDSLEKVRFTTACLRFLNAFMAMSRCEDSDENAGDFKSEDLLLSEEEELVKVLLSYSNEIDAAITNILPSAFASQSCKAIVGNPSALCKESVSCAFLDGYLSFVAFLLIHAPKTGSGGLDTPYNKLADNISDLLVTKLQFAAQSKPKTVRDEEEQDYTARQGWLNRAHSAIVKFLVILPKTPESRVERALAFSVLGRLNRGDEGIAAVLLSYDILFQVIPVSSTKSKSLVSTIFIRELCRTAETRTQLDHSFKLQNGPGINPNGLGPFGLQSLLSEAEGSRSKTGHSEYFLPLNNLWLWQTLSGSVVKYPGSEIAEHEAPLVLLECLKVIDDVERVDASGMCVYARRLPPGGMLYHLSNICFHPESVLCNTQIMSMAEQLFNKHSDIVDADFVRSFSRACLIHSSSKSNGENRSTDTRRSTKDEDKVATLLQPENQQDSFLNKETSKALKNFVMDLCNVYIEYGAQYALFPKCFLLLLRPAFPSHIRCEVLQRLRGLLHLLTIDKDSELAPLLHKYLLGGMPAVDNSAKDSPDFIDALCSLFPKGNGIRTGSDFAASLAVAVLARSLASSLQAKNVGLSVSKRRLQSCEPEFTACVLETTLTFLTTDGTLADLVHATLNHKDFPKLHLLLPSFSVDGLTDANWELLLIGAQTG